MRSDGRMYRLFNHFTLTGDEEAFDSIDPSVGFLLTCGLFFRSDLRNHNRGRDLKPLLRHIATTGRTVELFEHTFGLTSFTDAKQEVVRREENLLDVFLRLEQKEIFHFKKQNFASSLQKYPFEKYQNLPFRRELITALKNFIDEKETPEGAKKEYQSILTLLQDNVRKLSSLDPRSLEMKKSFLREQLEKDSPSLLCGIGRVQEDFHSSQIIFTDSHLIVCDRFDTGTVKRRNPYFDPKTDNRDLSRQAYVEPAIQVDTGRQQDCGVHAYTIHKTFRQMNKDKQEIILNKLTQPITFEDMLPDHQGGLLNCFQVAKTPDKALKAKRQKHGNCRLASLKESLGGLLLASILKKNQDKERGKQPENPHEVSKKISEIEKWHKQFKVFFRENILKNFINDETLPPEEKQYLLARAYIKLQTKPDSITKQNLQRAITGYFKENAITSFSHEPYQQLPTVWAAALTQLKSIYSPEASLGKKTDSRKKNNRKHSRGLEKRPDDGNQEHLEKIPKRRKQH